MEDVKSVQKFPDTFETIIEKSDVAKTTVTIQNRERIGVFSHRAASSYVSGCSQGRILSYDRFRGHYQTRRGLTCRCFLARSLLTFSEDGSLLQDSEQMEENRRRWLIAGMMSAIALVLIGLVCYVDDIRDHSHRSDCRGLKIQMICIAIQNYQLATGSFPPAYIVNKEGKPMHSWRVLLLPYIGEMDLYSRYDFNEPWNGPHNRLLADRVPVVYRCPANKGPCNSCTNYLAVVGRSTAWPFEKGFSIEDLKDTSSTCLLIAEVADSDVNWMEPRDLTVAQAVAGINVDRRRGISSYHSGGAYCGTVAGDAVFLRDGTSPAILKALVTVGGGAALSRSWSGEFSLTGAEEKTCQEPILTTKESKRGRKSN